MQARQKGEKGWLETGKDLLGRVTRKEEDVVIDFLEQSEHYRALKKIKKTSEDSKKGSFGDYALFQAAYQLHPFEEKQIADMAQAKTFAELLELTHIPKDQLNHPYAEKLLSVAGNVWQKANVGCYMFRLANEIKEFADKNFYSLNYVKQGFSAG